MPPPQSCPGSCLQPSCHQWLKACMDPVPRCVRELPPSAELGFTGASLYLGTQRNWGDSSQTKLGSRDSTQGNTETGHKAMATGMSAANQAKIYLLQKGFRLRKSHLAPYQVAGTHAGSHSAAPKPTLCYCCLEPVCILASISLWQFCQQLS